MLHVTLLFRSLLYVPFRSVPLRLVLLRYATYTFHVAVLTMYRYIHYVTLHLTLYPGNTLRYNTLARNRVFAIYQILLGWKTYKYYHETDELPNPRPTQPKKK